MMRAYIGNGDVDLFELIPFGRGNREHLVAVIHYDHIDHTFNFGVRLMYSPADSVAVLFPSDEFEVKIKTYRTVQNEI